MEPGTWKVLAVLTAAVLVNIFGRWQMLSPGNMAIP